MIRVALTEWDRPPPVPVIVSVRVRLATFGSVSIVSTELPEFTIDAGLKATVARPGAPLTDRFTVPTNPCAVIVTVYVATAPRVIVRLVGVTDIVKSPFTTSATVAVRTRGPLVP